MNENLSPYLPILLAAIVAFAIGGGVTVASLFLGPKKPNSAKLDVYECGIPVKTSAHQKISVKFYLTAILFILFDIEVIFLYLWASSFDYLGWFGLVEVGLFIGTLVAGYLYVLKRGALVWD
jgi:NADH-quinone oxidoreductase subunit A